MEKKTSLLYNTNENYHLNNKYNILKENNNLC